ncbi:RDD family protein [Phenylobacterium sp.]|uniref:RDD family protein n=1 Tax=Phenylobacterium sp. TaxID=1871053 RepID=UPI002B86FBF3|nr:RDD family protein [Phenylobacterium sp.]HLZ75016.1 RDD family protein [Phenylobacterium sp.]
MTDEQTAKSRSVGWRRVGAFVIDSVVVGLIGVVPGFAAFDAMARMGEWARLIGLAIAVVYFGLFATRLGGGRTPGQRALGLKVVGRDGQPPGPARAALRAAILAAPFVLNGVSLNGTEGGVLAIAVAMIAGALLFGLGLAQLYLLLFNGPERRLAHDLVTRTAVVAADRTEPLGPARKLPVRIAAGIFAVVFMLLVGVSVYFEANTTVLAASRDRLSKVERLQEVMSATAGENTTAAATLQTGTTVTHAVFVAARLNRWPKDPNAEVRRLAQAALAAAPLASGQRLFVSFTYGFSIGFGSGWRSYGRAVDTPPAT